MSHALRDAICDACLWSTAIMFGIFALIVVIPWIWDKTKYMRMHLREIIRYRVKRHRLHQAYKVSDEPSFKAQYWRRGGGWR